MSTLGRYGSAISGLHAAQVGLSVTGHNMSNSTTTGYVRQRSMQADSYYNSAGVNSRGKMQTGIGTSVSTICQFRDVFLDRRYRTQLSRYDYHQTRYNSVYEIEVLLGEIEGSARLSDSLNNLWFNLQELSAYPDGVETRKSFISSAESFLLRSQEIYSSLVDYQQTVNDQIKSTVGDINALVEAVKDITQEIMAAERSGQNANDLRDIRNNYLDALCSYGNVTYSEAANGQMTILFEEHELLSGNTIKKVGLRYMGGGYGYVEPVITDSDRILDPTDPAQSVFRNLYSTTVSTANDNDYGALKSLMLIRGQAPANYTTSETEVANTIIPKLQKQLDELFNKVVTLINDMIAPQDLYTSALPGPVGLDGSMGIELFVRRNVDRYGPPPAQPYIGENPANPETLYSITNVSINSLLSIDPGYSALALSDTGDVGDNAVVLRIMEEWENPTAYACYLTSASTGLNFTRFYTAVISDLGNEGAAAKNNADGTMEIINTLANERYSVYGVSMEEEMANMMIYQHAFNAASRLFNVVDSMTETLINLR